MEKITGPAPDRAEVPPGRRRGGLAATRSGGRFEERTFFCRTCQMVARGRHVPAGWYMVERALGGTAPHLRLGLYCSLPCLLDAGEELAVGEATHAERLGLPADTARDRARLVERVQTLLHQGATIRQAGDAIGVPTSTLRAWLRAAGVRVGPDGTLTGNPSVGSAPKRDKTLTDVLGQAGDRSPVSVLNELGQAGLLHQLTWNEQASGPGHAPVFSCTAQAINPRTGDTVHAQGRGPNKAAARTDAAAHLLAHLSRTTTPDNHKSAP